jgi:1-acyl-sn-glycerol-3-phosphate acyltransferase
MLFLKYLVFAVFSIIIATLTIVSKPFDLKGKISHGLLWTWCNGSLGLFGIKVNVSGQENIEFSKSRPGGITRGKGKVYISNHASYLDIFVILAKVPDNIRMIYKNEINKIPLISWAMLAANFVPINRTNVRMAMKSLDKAARKMQKGISFVIFPEGTRSDDGSVKDFKRGIFILAEKSEADIVPVSISGTFKLMPRGTLKVKPGNVNVVIGKPMGFRKEKEFLNEVRNVIKQNVSNN